MPARRNTQYIEFSGPVFDGRARERIQQAIGHGLIEMGELGAEILQGYIHQAGFIRLGSFVTSVEAEHVQQRGAGYVVVRPDEVWPKADRPTRTWFERGYRGGEKKRKANTGFAKTRSRLRSLSPDSYFLKRLGEALN